MKLINLIISFILFFYISLIFSNNAIAKIYIDIDSPTFQQFPIAICDLNNISAGAAQSSNIGITIADEIKNYLVMTGIFNILNKKSFFEEKHPGKAEMIENIIFSDWAMIGADYLVRGNITQSDKKIFVDCRLFDVTRGESILNKQYNSLTGDKKELAK